ncbi:MAG: GntR family transcriptional regulator [Bacteroidetes bacterium RIFCSPLOWO2_12_FULL_35_15]|nr:MAG: GntR family transcriptional regulator [Bacteroidetes bacterium RIFCSPLOWO2_12_FULL_35_15]
MINVGTYNELEVVKELEFGIYLREGDVEILMPTKWVPRGTKIGDFLNVFIFRDSDDRLIATTVKPFATADTFAFLEVKQVNNIGAFLDWGMDKDLLVPFREQPMRMDPGKSYVVFVYVDEETNRLVASGKLNRYLERENIEVREGDIVELLIYSETDLGYNAIINNRYSGLIYKNEIYEAIRVGDKVQGFVKCVREDNKIDLSLQKSGYELVDDVKWRILKMMKEENGFLSLSDNSSPEEIKAKLQISKKAFKKAVGALYRERLVKLTDKGVQLI